VTCFLDLDGTLIDVRRRYFLVHRASLPSAPVLDEAAYWELKRAGIDEATILGRHHPLVDVAGYLARRAALIEDDAMLAADTAIAGVDLALSRLAGLGELVLVTLRGRTDALDRQLGRLDLRRWFAAVLSAPAAGDPAATKAALMVGRARPGDWVIGDTEADVGAGRRLGLATCAVRSGIRAETALAALAPDLLVDDLAAAAAALAR
jgi:phosphoglycolate phosphatase-like HAD superfamily hydrolase